MKAVRVHAYGGPEVLKVDEIAKSAPNKGELVVEVRACGINPLDAWFRSGHLAARFARPLPYTPGTDIVGVVAELGEGVTEFNVGDLVMGILSPLADGGYAEYVTADAGKFVAVPDGLEPVQTAAALTPGVTGLQMADKAIALGNCRHILILGALGAVGRAALARAVSKGIEVTAAVRPGREMEALALGAKHTIAINDAAALTVRDRRFDCILDTIGPEAVALWEEALADGGTVISIVPLPPAKFTRTDVQMMPFAYSPDRNTTREAALLMRDGKLGAMKVESLALHETGKAHALLPQGSAGRKFVVEPHK